MRKVNFSCGQRHIRFQIEKHFFFYLSIFFFWPILFFFISYAFAQTKPLDNSQKPFLHSADLVHLWPSRWTRQPLCAINFILSMTSESKWCEWLLCWWHFYDFLSIASISCRFWLFFFYRKIWTMIDDRGRLLHFDELSGSIKKCRQLAIDQIDFYLHKWTNEWIEFSPISGSFISCIFEAHDHFESIEKWQRLKITQKLKNLLFMCQVNTACIRREHSFCQVTNFCWPT